MKKLVSVMKHCGRRRGGRDTLRSRGVTSTDGQNLARALAKQVDAANAANKAARDAASQSKQDATSNKNFVKQLEELASKRTQAQLQPVLRKLLHVI
ncbi:hypothetical protein [Pectobacterium aroidearum]|uniref:hypothetical protein n=1 Tax=Pectobacterium aroidearum TaxID=1201031 RepID=UPI002114DAED|nr:hypothetical protein [Pectobacterium aroidearum]UUE75490.1 hypothetical protein L0Y20_03660 [Pectobacterium aroidearum]